MRHKAVATNARTAAATRRMRRSAGHRPADSCAGICGIGVEGRFHLLPSGATAAETGTNSENRSRSRDHHQEANATRSLLNTAKLIEESPVLMRPEGAGGPGEGHREDRQAHRVRRPGWRHEAVGQLEAVIFHATERNLPRGGSVAWNLFTGRNHEHATHHTNSCTPKAAPRRSRAGCTACRWKTQAHAAAAQHRHAAVRRAVGRGDARRAPGHRRDGRLGRADARRDHPGRGRRRHRLRHGRGAHHAARRATCRTTWRSCAARSSAACRSATARVASTAACPTASRRRLARVGPDGAAGARSATSTRRSARTRSTGRSARSAAATTSSRSASTRPIACG